MEHPHERSKISLLALMCGVAAMTAVDLSVVNVALPSIQADLHAKSAGLLWASFLGLIYEATLFTQQVLHYTPLLAGSATIPIAVLSLSISARVAPKVITRIGAAKTLAIGMAVQGVGLLLLTRVPSDASNAVDILPAFSIVGVGLGFAQVAMQIAALAGVERDEAGLAGGARRTARSRASRQRFS
jgi:MFS family permease